MHRYSTLPGFLVFGLLLLCGTVVAGVASAAPAPAVPGHVAWHLGDVEIIALQDRPREMPITLFAGGDPAVAAKLLPEGKAPASMSAFAIKRGAEIILVDTGYGSVGTGASLLPENMEKAGLKPEAVTLILLTHMHPDHIGGLVLDGKKYFPNAQVRVSAPEAGYWLNAEARAKAPEKAQAGFALAESALKVYGSAWGPLFAFGDSPTKGFTAFDATGHTPGHTAYLLEAGGKKFLFIGDLIHAAALQFAAPEFSSSYDMDPAKAADARRKYLAMAAEQNLPVAGPHLPFPGVGHVKKGPGNGFTFVPGLD